MTARRPIIVGSVGRVARDVRALGFGAPLRAAYEASKRLGGHDLVFRVAVPPRQSPRYVQTPFAVPDRIPDAARARAIEEADRILDGSVRVFGVRVPFDRLPDWHAVMHDDGQWPVIPWWRIDLRSDRRTGDVKWAWELGRHRHLVILARAAYAADDTRYLDALESHLSSWLDANPPEMGVHWYSNLEIALRAIAWLQILALVRGRLTPGIVDDMENHLFHAGRHLMADLPYTVSTMRNNHLLGDALGLIALGTTFHRQRWVRVGERIFGTQLARHMRADGSMIEDSVSYHRFVLEMLITRVLMGGAAPEVDRDMVAAAQFLCRLGALNGSVPQYGDWDEGRVLTSTGDPADLAGSVFLALGLGGSGAEPANRNGHDEVAWHVAEGTPLEPETAERDGADLGAGIARIERGTTSVWLKMGGGPSHGHADRSSVTIVQEGRFIFGDPGTATYNGDIRLRNHFRGSTAHNVVRVGGAEQMEAHRAFRWLSDVHGVLGPSVTIDVWRIMWGVHDAFSSADRRCRVARVVAVSDGGTVVVRDHVEAPTRGSRMLLQFPPGIDVAAAARPHEFVVGTRGATVRFTGAASTHLTCGAEDPLAGWWSMTYGSWEPAAGVSVELEAAAMSGFDWLPTEQSGDIDQAVSWHPDRVRLEVNVAGVIHVNEVAIA
jgi:hypothetical protein